MVVRYSLLVFAVSLWPIPAVAQDAIQDAVGARVRAVAFVNSCMRPERDVGTLAARYGDTISIRIDRETITAIPLNAVRELGVSDGQSRTKGFLRGALAGAVLGALIGIQRVSSSLDDDNAPSVANRKRLIAFGAGAAIGGAAGGAVGSLFPTERWRKIPLPPHVKLAPECPSIHPMGPLP